MNEHQHTRAHSAWRRKSGWSGGRCRGSSGASSCITGMIAKQLKGHSRRSGCPEIRGCPHKQRPGPRSAQQWRSRRAPAQAAALLPHCSVPTTGTRRPLPSHTFPDLMLGQAEPDDDEAEAPSPKASERTGKDPRSANDRNGSTATDAASEKSALSQHSDCQTLPQTAEHPPKAPRLPSSSKGSPSPWPSRHGSAAHGRKRLQSRRTPEQVSAPAPAASGPLPGVPGPPTAPRRTPSPHRTAPPTSTPPAPPRCPPASGR